VRPCAILTDSPFPKLMLAASSHIRGATDRDLLTRRSGGIRSRPARLTPVGVLAKETSIHHGSNSAVNVIEPVPASILTGAIRLDADPVVEATNIEGYGTEMPVKRRQSKASCHCQLRGRARTLVVRRKRRVVPGAVMGFQNGLGPGRRRATRGQTILTVYCWWRTLTGCGQRRRNSLRLTVSDIRGAPN
jgi:hypothetical protein